MSERAELIERAVKDEFGEGYDYSWDELPGTGSSFTLNVDGRPIEVKIVEQESGFDNTDMDATYPATQTRIVLLVEGVYYLKEGKYESFVGSDWSRPLREVVPTTKTITVFE